MRQGGPRPPNLIVLDPGRPPLRFPSPMRITRAEEDPPGGLVLMTPKTQISTSSDQESLAAPTFRAPPEGPLEPPLTSPRRAATSPLHRFAVLTPAAARDREVAPFTTETSPPSSQHAPNLISGRERDSWCVTTSGEARSHKVIRKTSRRRGELRAGLPKRGHQRFCAKTRRAIRKIQSLRKARLHNCSHTRAPPRPNILACHLLACHLQAN